jgi:CubicO group peptidase (beta-lactamase class C family)
MIRTLVESLVSPILIPNSGIGAAIGIKKGNQEYFFGLGETQKNATTAPTPETLYEIGSLTKIFTTLLLVNIAKQNNISLDTPIQGFIPLPNGITWRQLATHTSGLPHLPRNIIWSFLKNRHNPYANYTENELAAYLKRCSVNHQRVNTVHYSNLGMGLLGYLLTERTGQSYNALLQEKICLPLGMQDTASGNNPQNQHRLAEPHNGNALPTSNWDFHPPFEGTGAIRSTTQDLLKLISAYFADHPLPEPRNLGWFQSFLTANRKPVWWHSGATGGYQAFIGVIKDIELGVVILANRGLYMREYLFPKLYITEMGFTLLNYLSS